MGCVEGHKIDDQHVGLPNWEIHAKPVGQDAPHLVTTTDGTGYFRFDNMTPGQWEFWEIMQVGWEPVTADMFVAQVIPGPDCIYVRFKNRQTTPTPTATPIPPDTPAPPQNPIYLPIIITPGGVCQTGRLQVTVWGTFYSFPLAPDGNIKTIKPMDWQSSTTFRIVNYQGPVTWTQYKPSYYKQHGGYEFVYPGGQAGEIFWMTVQTSCGTIVIASPVDDPTPTPAPGAVSMRSPYLPLLHRWRF